MNNFLAEYSVAYTRSILDLRVKGMDKVTHDKKKYGNYLCFIMKLTHL